MQNDGFAYAVIIGDANIDVTIPLDPLIKLDRTSAAVGGGGTSANTAVALRKLGIPTAFMGTLGQDFGGRYMLNELRDADINTTLTRTVPDYNTVSVFAFIDEEGERHLWAFPREREAYTQMELLPEDLEKIRSSRWVHSSGMTYMKPGPVRTVIPEIFKAAYEAGVPTSFDLNTRAEKFEDLDPGIRDAVMQTIPYVTYLLGSAKDEFYSLYPCEDWVDSVAHFAAPGRAVIARMGGEGTAVYYNGFWEMQKAFDVPVVNTTGAGDSFNAGFIAGMLTGKSLSAAVTWGNAVAGYKVSGDGARYTPDAEGLRFFLETAKRKG